MNDLKAAVFALECMIDSAEQFADGVDDVVRVVIHTNTLQQLNTGLSALRDALQRQDGCKYCAGDWYDRKPLAKWDTYFDNWIKEEHEIRIDDYEGEYFVSSSPGEGPGFDIRYCPMCGRQFSSTNHSDAADKDGEKN